MTCNSVIWFSRIFCLFSYLCNWDAEIVSNVSVGSQALLCLLVMLKHLFEFWYSLGWMLCVRRPLFLPEYIFLNLAVTLLKIDPVLTGDQQYLTQTTWENSRVMSGPFIESEMCESIQLLPHRAALFVKVKNMKLENTVILMSCFCLLFLINVQDIIKPLLFLPNNFDVRCVFVLFASNMLG